MAYQHRPFMPAVIAAGLFAVLWPAGAFAQPYEKAGWQAELSTIAHGVSGTVTIVDEHTLRVDDFYYDGGGISVFFWLNNPLYSGVVFGPGPTNEDFGLGGDLVRDTPYLGESFMLDLGERSMDDHDAVSVWCVTFGADFGHGVFEPPTVPEPSSAAAVLLLLAGVSARRGRRG